MSFESWVVAICDRFVSQRTFDLVVAPALADLEFEEAAGRRSRIGCRAAVLRAIAGGIGQDLRRGSGGFLKLTLLSASYYLLPIMVLASTFRTWSGFVIAAVLMLLFTDLHYRGCAARTGHRPWPGPGGRFAVVAGSLPALLSPRWATLIVNRVERDFLRAAGGLGTLTPATPVAA